MATAELLRGYESLVTTQRDKNKIPAVEIKFLRNIKGCTRLDKHRNEVIRGYLHIYPSDNRIHEYKQMVSTCTTHG